MTFVSGTGGTYLTDGSVTTPKIATAAVTLPKLGSTARPTLHTATWSSSFSSTSTSLVDIPNTTVTFTAKGGGVIALASLGETYADNDDTGTFVLLLNGATIQGTTTKGYGSSATTRGNVCLAASSNLTASTSYTFKCQGSTGANSFYVNNGSQPCNVVVVEV